MRFANPYHARQQASPNGVKGVHSRNIAMKMTMSAGSTMTPRIHRKVLRTPSKLHAGKLHPGKLHSGKRQPNKGLPNKILMHQLHHSGKMMTSRGKMLSRTQIPRPIEACDNSNDSGLGFDNLIESNSTHKHNNLIRFSEDLQTWREENSQSKIPKTDFKFDSDDANDNFNFPEMAKTTKQLSSSSTYKNGINGGKCSTLPSRKRMNLAQAHSPTVGRITLCSQLSSHTRNGSIQLQIIGQPEQQHRARYQTEGSRGAVKDRSGNGFPVVRLNGYDKPAILQVFIGTDIGRVAPHMFYQACRVFGKNSTPCTEKKEDGTVLIEIEFDPQKNWQVTCDCVGILKERNVDVEHRFGDQTGQRCKKKSTRCRMVFRTLLQHDDGTTETIQVCSQPIVCTQPPGVPEICRKSLVSCPASGGLELFLIGKNFLKDSKVVFQSDGNSSTVWKDQVCPDKEFLQQNHLVCCVPPYVKTNITEPVNVKLFVVSGDKASESLNFSYTPVNKNSGPLHSTIHHSVQGLVSGYYINNELQDEVKPVLLWESGSASDIMPPPAAPLRRPSIILPDNSPPLNDFKSELTDDSSQGSLIDSENGDIVSSMRNGRYKLCNENSMDMNDANTDGLRIRVRQLPLETIAHDNNLRIIPHTDNSNLPMVVDNNSTLINQINENNMEMLVRHNENTKLSVGEDRNVISYAHSSNISPQLLDPQMMNGNSERSSQVLVNSPSISCEMLNAPRRMSPDELKVMDLRMKPGNIGSENDPSFATIRQFVHSHTKLPAQTGQSVETYLSNIDNKTLISQNNNGDKPTSIVTFSQQLQTLQNQNSTDKVMESVAAAIFHSSDDSNNRPSLYSSQSSIQQMVIPPVTPIDQLIATKQMHNTMMQDIPYSSNIMSAGLDTSQVKAEMFNSACSRTDHNCDNATGNLPHHQSMLNNQSVQMGALVSSFCAVSKLDSMINSSVENHLNSTHTDSSPPRRSPSTHDIILSAHSSPDIVMSTSPSQISPVNQDMIHNTGVLSPEIILNPQVSPTMMCSSDSNLLSSQPLSSAIPQQLLSNPHTLTQESQENMTIINNNQTNPTDNLPLIQSHQIMSPTVKTPPSAVKDMILNAAAEIFTSDKAIDALVTTAIKTANILTNENAQNQPSLICNPAPTVSVVELQQTDQQNIDGSSAQFSSAIPFTPQLSSDQFTPQVIVDKAVGNFVSQMKEENANETSVMSQAVTQAVSQAVSQVFSQAVTQTVNQEMKTSNATPMQTSMGDNEILTSMSDNELLNYINPSCFDQV